MPHIARQSILATAAVLWAGALILAAFIASRPEIGPAAYTLSAAIYGIGALICHQRPERSFHLWGAQLPVCARCAGLAILFAALPTLLTLTYEWTTGHMPANWVRAAAGFPLGAIVAWVLVADYRSASAVEIH